VRLHVPGAADMATNGNLTARGGGQIPDIELKLRDGGQGIVIVGVSISEICNNISGFPFPFSELVVRQLTVPLILRGFQCSAY
jgi:hypothetical protein